MYAKSIIIDDMNLGTVDIYRTKVDAHMWHRRMGHCNPRALQQLVDEDQSGDGLNCNIDAGDCEVCSAGNSKKEQSPLV